MTRQTRSTKTLATKKDDRWTTARGAKTVETAPVIDPELKTLQDRTSDMSTLGQMLARLRAERR